VSTETAAPPARLKARYLEEIRPALMQRFGYTSIMQAPKIEKIVLNMGVGDAKQDSKALEAAQEQLATIAGQKPNVRRARKSIANFKLREGMPVGLAVTLRHERAYEFLDRLMSVAIPRIRDFRGLKANAFDGRGNYSLGIREQTIFPEIDYDSVDQVRGLDVTITTSAQSDLEAFALLEAFGMPFSKENRPDKAEQAARQAAVEEAERHEEARAKAQAEQTALEQLKEENPEAYERPAEEPAEETQEEAD
jgi:large subunit ribosomal protein L5